MTTLSLLTSDRYASSGGDVSFSRNDFKIYIQSQLGSGARPLNVDGYEHYRGLGVGILDHYYDTTSTMNSANGAAGVDVVCTHTITVSAGVSMAAGVLPTLVDLWYTDVETQQYGSGQDSWDTTHGAVAISDATALYDATVAQFATHGFSDAKVGAYSAGPCGFYPYAGYNYWQSWSPSTVTAREVNNDACGYYLSRIWDFALPECYTNSMDALATTIDQAVYEKARTASPIKIIPLFWPSDTISYQITMARLEYCIRQPDVYGCAFWAVTSNTCQAAPVYYDNYGWMRAVQDFIQKYGLTKGTPF